MRCTLLVPHLIWPRETADSAAHGLELPALSTLLARADSERFAAITPDAWLCQAFEVERQTDWPIAPLTLALDGGEPDGAYWLRADPVHIKVSREGLHLIDSALFDVSDEEAQSFVESLNAHFTETDMRFCAPHPKRWYVKCSEPPAISTRTLSEVAGQDVQRNLPEGDHALEWHKRFNEAQMLLHAHRLNEAREERGEPPVNSVWFWGGGKTPAVRGHHFATVSTTAASATALAVAADIAVRELHPDGDTFVACASTTSSPLPHLAILDQLAGAVAYDDAAAWRERIVELERHWFAPLLGAIRAGRVTQLDLIALQQDHSAHYTVTRGGLLKLWRRPKPLVAYA